MSTIYDIQDLSFTYSDSEKKVLDGVNLQLTEGEIFSVLGRNGAGKSTLLGCMLGLLKAQSGCIQLGGKALRHLTEREIAAQVGYVPQNHDPAFAYTVFDFVQMGCAARIGLFSHPGKHERDDTQGALEQMGIGHLADRPYTTLSGGERQQVFIARAIVAHPRIVLFDEPTAHLDFGNQLRVLKIIKSLTESGYAAVITTHNPDHALLLGGQAAILDKQGHLLTGSVDEVITETSLKALYGSELRLEYVAALQRKVCLYPNL